MRKVLSVLVLVMAACSAPQPSDPLIHRPGIDVDPFDEKPTDTPKAACTVPQLDAGDVRPADIMSGPVLELVATRLPCVADEALVAILESSDTLWYDKSTMIPSYQDSSGDNVTFPVGMRPNTIDPNLIVDGGHEVFFADIGNFHFPFGRPIGSPDGSAVVVDFWHVPRVEGELIPVVWWLRQPNGFTWRYEWMFPKDTVIGEMMFIVDSGGQWWPFEIRTRTRQLSGWDVDVLRPFPEAETLAAALEPWEPDASVKSLIDHLRDDATLSPAQLSAPFFTDVFPTIEGAVDRLPALDDPAIIQELLREQPFVSARGKTWKTSGSLTTYAPTTDADFHIVPPDYNAGFVAVDNESCNRCHRDAGHPFKDFHFFVYLYGEIWGADETFSWHPFEQDLFVDENGAVKNFNYNNREPRQDFVDAGILEEYDPSVHGVQVYQRLMQAWSDFEY